MSKNFYASRDGDGQACLWYGRPKWDQMDQMFESPDWAADNRNRTQILLGPEQVEDCKAARTIMRAIWPKGIKPGECKKVRLPKLEIIE